MSLSCQECGSSNLRRAHFRISDAFAFFAPLYPVRCRDCKNSLVCSHAQSTPVAACSRRRRRTEKAL